MALIKIRIKFKLKQKEKKSEVKKIEEQFKMSPDLIVKIPSTINAIFNNFVCRKNYYSKPSFLDVQLED